jgi:hypothetical protein
MNTLTNTHTHTPHMESISNVGDFQYTFCETCEMNIDRFYIYDDYDRLPFWTDWSLTK